MNVDTPQLTLRAASKEWLVEFYEAGGLTALVMNLSDVEVIEDKTDKDVQVRWYNCTVVRVPCCSRIFWTVWAGKPTPS